MRGTPVVDPSISGLPAMDVGGRLDRLRCLLSAAGVDTLVVSGPTNIRYLTGFTGSAGLLVVGAAEAVLVTDRRYELQAASELGAAGVAATIEIGGADAHCALIAAAVARAGCRRLGLEADHVSWSRQRSIAGSLPRAEVVPTTGLVEGLRRIKDEGERARIAAAAAVADEALASVRPLLDERGGAPSERALALALDSEMRRLGADDPAFETIVAGGPNGARPHHRPTSRRIGAGEAVVVDFGARVDGYRSDMTRTLCVGALVDAELRRAMRVVAVSQAAGVAAVRAGTPASEVDGACRAVIEQAGWGERFSHGTGHGVGLDIHEEPSVAGSSADTLEAGQVVTVEPGVYLPGRGGVRIEDTVVVTGAGCTPLTHFPKDLP